MVPWASITLLAWKDRNMAKELALIGCGNMGTAMLKGIVGSGLVAA